MKTVFTLMAAGAMLTGAASAQSVKGQAAPQAPRPLDEALNGKADEGVRAPQAHRGRDRGDDEWGGDWWDGGRDDWDDRDWGDRDWDDVRTEWEDRDRRRGRSLRLTCGSEDYRYRFCDLPGRAQNVVLLRQRSWAPCREGHDWGQRRGGIWVDNGCEAEFRVSYQARGYAGGYGYGYDDRRDPPPGVIRSCLREARFEHGESYRLDRVLRAEQGRRGWRISLRLERESDRRHRRYDRRNRHLDVVCRTGRRGVQIATR